MQTAKFYEFNECEERRRRMCPVKNCCELGFWNWFTLFQDWPVLMWWRVQNQECRPGTYQTRTLIQSVSQEIRLDWWFVMAAGSVSISFTCTPPHPPGPPTLPPPAAAHPFAPVPHCGVIRTATLERGDDNSIHTQSLEYILHLPPDFGRERVSAKVERMKLESVLYSPTDDSDPDRHVI